MGLLTHFKKSIIIPDKTKTFYPAPQSGFQTAGQYFQQAFNHMIVGVESYFIFYQQVMPLQDAINKIGEKLAAIEVVLQERDGTIIINHPFLSLLKKPNFNQSQSDFLEELSKDFSIAANAYIIITLSTQNTPLELFIAPPQNVLAQEANQGEILKYEYTYVGRTTTFNRVFINNEIQYLTQDGRARILHLKGYNPNSESRRRFGLSKMHGMLYELMLYRAGALHNYSLLKQGGRPSLWMKPYKRLNSEDADQRLRAEIANLTEGAQNAGRIIVSSEIEEIQKLIVTNVDMDYSVLESKTYNKIYQTYHVPLPVITNEASTFSNYEVAQSAIIKEAVLPEFKRFATFFTRFILPYYEGAEPSLRVTCIKSSIDALRAEAIEEMKNLQPLGILSDNQMLQEIGKPRNKDDDANDVWKSSQLIPSYKSNN